VRSRPRWRGPNRGRELNELRAAQALRACFDDLRIGCGPRARGRIMSWRASSSSINSGLTAAFDPLPAGRGESLHPSGSPIRGASGRRALPRRPIAKRPRTRSPSSTRSVANPVRSSCRNVVIEPLLLTRATSPRSDVYRRVLRNFIVARRTRVPEAVGGASLMHDWRKSRRRQRLVSLTASPVRVVCRDAGAPSMRDSGPPYCLIEAGRYVDELRSSASWQSGGVVRASRSLECVSKSSRVARAAPGCGRRPHLMRIAWRTTPGDLDRLGCPAPCQDFLDRRRASKEVCP